jgi:hypothetical protein
MLKNVITVVLRRRTSFSKRSLGKSVGPYELNLVQNAQEIQETAVKQIDATVRVAHTIKADS